MFWKKIGIITKPNPHIPWLYTWTSAACLANQINGTAVPLYITGREKSGASRIGIGIFHLDTFRVTNLSPLPCISLGDRGMFDEHGTSYPSVLINNNTYFLYYTGWIRGTSVPWYNAVGLAKSIDGIHFKKISESPIFDRNPLDPIGMGSCCVIKETNMWKMWYTSFSRWKKLKNTTKHFYYIKHAQSTDGVHWTPSRHICIDFANTREYAIAKPSVIKVNSTYFMWYSYRGRTYHIGCATSKDGIAWKRRDHDLGLSPSTTGWDSEMVCYPYVFAYKDALLMFYNGNGYGKSGLGIATVKKNELHNYL
ncbi:MAG: hypothetical protein UT26_C0001G0010 [Microgenomates group bacterium GW2011_GWC1_39_12]|nr:MAG: hypothetical protein UT26_C0001G0010 [Microgenomates group bacterium GW2011_GWC1_39_12]